MKQIKWILYALLSFLPLGITLAILPGLPEQIPAHYGLDGTVDRWGSRYETLIFPAIILLFSALMLVLTRLAARQGRQNRDVALLTGMLGLVLFNGLNYYFLYTSAVQAEKLYAMPLDLMRFVMGLLGACLMALGPFMPRLRRNRLLGLRTRWSLKNDQVWQQSQLFCGRSLLAAGAILVLLAIFLSGIACLVAGTIVLVLLEVVDTWYTWKLTRKKSDKKCKNENNFEKTTKNQ